MNKRPKLRFKGFEGEWEEKKLGDISDSFSGGTPTVGIKKYYGGDIPFIRSGEIHSDKTQLLITEEGLSNSSAKLIKKGTLLYALYGATSGDVSIAKIDGAINQAILAIIPKPLYNSTFLENYLFKNKNAIVETFLQGGQGNLSGEIVKNIEVKFPSLPEQRLIATYFTHLDTLIESSRQRVEKLKQVKAACLQAMFPQKGNNVPKIRFKGCEGEWTEKTLGEICIFDKGRGYSKSDLEEVGIPLLLYGRMYTNYSFWIDKVDCFTTLKHDSYISEGNEVVIPASGETAEEIVRASAITSSGIILGGDLNILKFDKKIYSTPFIALSISTGKLYNELTKCAQGKTIVHLHNSEIKKGKILVPSLPEQRKIAAFFTHLDTSLRLEQQRHAKLQQVKRASLTQMFV